MRAMGTVKWFDQSASTGCAVSEGGVQATFTNTTLAPFGLSKVAAGTPLTFEVILEAGRLIVSKFYEIAGRGPHLETAIQSQITLTAPATPPQRVQGKVQWFDPNKGYGFIVVAHIDNDVLLHRSVIEAFGLSAIKDGAIIDCEIKAKSRGLQLNWQATRIYEIVDPDPSHPESTTTMSRLPADPVQVVPNAQWQRAECKWWSRPKGYGFVRVAETDADVFVTIDVLRQWGLVELKQKQQVLVIVGNGPKGLTATAIKLEEP